VNSPLVEAHVIVAGGHLVRFIELEPFSSNFAKTMNSRHYGQHIVDG
jgi:hypothetical protein